MEMSMRGNGNSSGSTAHRSWILKDAATLGNRDRFGG
jgi:hypothetical protein